MNNKLLHENQFGFQINNSTEHAILQFTRDIAQNFDNGKFTKHFQNILGLMKKHWLVSKTIFPKENNILKILMKSNIYLKLIVVSHTGL